MDGFARRTDQLRGAVEVNSYRVTAARAGTTLEVLPADGAVRVGSAPVIRDVDELGQWPSTRGAHQIWDAVTSAAAKVPGCRMIVMSTASDPAHWSRKIL